MKKSILLLWVLMSSATILLNGCSKDEEFGDLIVNVENLLGESMIGKTVYLYKGKGAYDALEYSETAVTDNSGQVRFTNLIPDTYYFEADFEVLGIDYTASGSATVTAGLETTVTMTP